MGRSGLFVDGLTCDSAFMLELLKSSPSSNLEALPAGVHVGRIPCRWKNLSDNGDCYKLAQVKGD